jgi:putative transposase
MKPARARQLVEYLRTSYRISMRRLWRACGVVCFGRSSYHYRHRRPEQASLRKRIRELSGARVRCGYRRIHVLLRREGRRINHNRTRRLYRQEDCNCAGKRQCAAEMRGLAKGLR